MSDTIDTTIDSATSALVVSREGYNAAVTAYGERPSELARKRVEGAKAAADAAELDLILANARQTALDRQATERTRLALKAKLDIESANASHARFISEAKPLLEDLARNVRDAEATIAALDRVHAAQAAAAGRALYHAKDLLCVPGDRALADAEVAQLVAVALHHAGVGARVGALLLPTSLQSLQRGMHDRGETGRALAMHIESHAREAGFGNMKFSLSPACSPPAWNDPLVVAWEDARRVLGLPTDE